MKKNIILIILISGIGLLTFGCDGSPEKISEKIIKKVSTKLDLNDAQLQKLEKVKIAVLAEYKNKKQDRTEYKEIFKNMLMEDRLNKDSIKAILDEKSDKFDLKFEKIFPLIQEFHLTLSSEQKQKLVGLAEKIQKKKLKRCN